MSSSDPRGRFRGGVTATPGDAVIADLGSGVIKGAATGGVDRTRAGCMFADRPDGARGAGPGAAAGGAALADGVVAFAMPMNVVRENMTRTLARQWLANR